jgi:hypothetical protein
MCRPSSCNNASHESAGIAAVAVIAILVFIAVKIGPIVARIFHVAVEVLAIITLTVVAALACLLLGWLTACIVRWRNRRHHAHKQTTLRPVPVAARQHTRQASGDPDCLACGDTGTVLCAIGGRYQARPCPACEPLVRAG